MRFLKRVVPNWVASLSEPHQQNGKECIESMVFAPKPKQKLDDTPADNATAESLKVSNAEDPEAPKPKDPEVSQPESLEASNAKGTEAPKAENAEVRQITRRTYRTVRLSLVLTKKVRDTLNSGDSEQRAFWQRNSARFIKELQRSIHDLARSITKMRAETWLAGSEAKTSRQQRKREGQKVKRVEWVQKRRQREFSPPSDLNDIPSTITRTPPSDLSGTPSTTTRTRTGEAKLPRPLERTLSYLGSI